MPDKRHVLKQRSLFAHKVGTVLRMHVHAGLLWNCVRNHIVVGGGSASAVGGGGGGGGGAGGTVVIAAAAVGGAAIIIIIVAMVVRRRRKHQVNISGSQAVKLDPVCVTVCGDVIPSGQDAAVPASSGWAGGECIEMKQICPQQSGDGETMHTGVDERTELGQCKRSTVGPSGVAIDYEYKNKTPFPMGGHDELDWDYTQYKDGANDTNSAERVVPAHDKPVSLGGSYGSVGGDDGGGGGGGGIEYIDTDGTYDTDVKLGMAGHP